MTVQEVEARVQAIRDAADSGDDEAAHSMEDSLYYDVVSWIATRSIHVEAREVAIATVKTKGMNFSRWCA